MGFSSLLRYSLTFLSGLYFGYKYYKAVAIYDQELQKLRQTCVPVYNNDSQSDASSTSSSDNHSEPEFIDRKLTSLGRESPKESDDLESSESSEEISDSDKSLNSEKSSNSGYMRSFMSAINQIGPGGHSTETSSRVVSPSEASDGLGSPQTPIVVHDSDDTNVPASSSIMATIRTVGSNIPLGFIMVSRPDHSYSRSPSTSPGTGCPYSPNSGYNSNDNAKNDKSDNESDKDTDPCELYNCFA